MELSIFLPEGMRISDPESRACNGTFLNGMESVLTLVLHPLSSDYVSQLRWNVHVYDKICLTERSQTKIKHVNAS